MPFAGALRLFTLGSLALLCRSQQAPTFTIAGHVVRHLDQRAIKGARVSLTMVKDIQRQISAITSENGGFSFQGVPAGKYQLRVTDHGTSQLYQETENYSTAIVTGPGLDSEHILFALDSPATLSGTIVDEENDPVPQATVYLFTHSVVSGKNQTRSGGQTNTDTAGALHFRHLSPGTYYVAVVGRPWYAQNMSHSPSQPATHSELDVAYPTTYYAGSTSPDSATPLKLEEGAKAEIQLILHAVPSLHIGVDGLGETDHGVNVSVTQLGPGGITIQLPVGFAGSELVGIAPGNYLLSLQDPSQARGSSEPQAVSLTGDTTLHLDNQIKTSISGKVISASDTSAGLAVLLMNEATSRHYAETVHADGTFEFQRASAGHYRIALANAPDTYPAKVEVRGAIYTNGELEVPKGAQVELIITAGHGLSKVEGIVVQDKKPFAGAMVLLIPQDLHHGKAIVRDQSDSDGTFTLNSVKPGRYSLVAIDDGRGLAYAEQGTITPYLEHAPVVDVPLANNNVNIEVEVQHRQ